jgi:hypothetical protein
VTGEGKVSTFDAGTFEAIQYIEGANKAPIAVNSRNQALTQVCAFCSPESASMSDIAIYHQLTNPHLSFRIAD